MARFAKFFVLLSVLLLTFSVRHLQTAIAGNPPPEGKEAVLKAADITPKFFPEKVFFRGQIAPVQFRNTGGVRFADDFYVLAGLVDNSGYSRELREKYQAYLLSEVTLEIGGQTLKPALTVLASWKAGSLWSWTSAQTMSSVRLHSATPR